MDKLQPESIEWSLTHITRFGDTDLFPVPFEFEAIKHSWGNLKTAIADIDLETYEVRPFQRILVPKQDGCYRVAIQLDPIDTIIYTALAYEAAGLIEKIRVPIEEKVACSYRVSLDSNGELFRKNNGWDDYHSKSQELANSGLYKLVVTADIADFFNQIGHHRVRNSLENAGVREERAKNIENLLLNFTKGQSQGIPIGPSASSLFAEACLSDVDSFLIRKNYVHTRYVDDFRIFCTDRSQAQRAMHSLTEYLYTAHRLALQSHKTKVWEISEFIEKELIDPEELENESQEELLDSLQSIISIYADEEFMDEPDLSELVRNNLVDLFDSCLFSEPIHLGTAKYLLRRATALRTGVLRTTVLSNVEKLAPAMREVAHYLIATTKTEFAASIGLDLIKGCKSSSYEFLPYVRMWLLNVLQKKMSNSLESEIADLCGEYATVLGRRPYALLAREKNYIDWVREQKETVLNNTPWDRRAIIWSAKALSGDELMYWLKRVQNAGDLLDKAIAQAVLNLKQNESGQ